MSATEALRGRAVSGLLWGALGSVVSKVASFAAQIYVGWVLSKSDFGLYAIALGCSAFFSGLVGGGTQRILIQRGRNYDQLAGDVIQIALLFNVAVCALISLSAWPMARHFGNPTLIPLLLIMAVATVVATPGPVLSAKLSIELRFGTLQRLAMCSHIVRFGSLILFAHLGLRSLAFALPLLLIAITDSYLAWRVVGSIPIARILTVDRASDILRSSRWVMVGSFANAMIQNGGNIAVALLADQLTLGVFFFAFQLTFSFASLVGGMLQQVIISTMVKMGDDRNRRGRAFARSIAVVALIGSALGFAVAILASFSISHIWAGKWNESISVVQVLSLGIPAVLISWIARAAIEASGRWPLVTTLIAMEGVLTVIATVGGTALGGLNKISVSLLTAQLAASAIQVVVASRYLGLRSWDALQAVLAASASGLIALSIAITAVRGSVLRDNAALPQTVAALSIYLVVFGVLAMILCRRAFLDFYELVVHGMHAVTRRSLKVVAS